MQFSLAKQTDHALLFTCFHAERHRIKQIHLCFFISCMWQKVDGCYSLGYNKSILFLVSLIIFIFYSLFLFIIDQFFERFLLSKDFWGSPAIMNPSGQQNLKFAFKINWKMARYDSTHILFVSIFFHLLCSETLMEPLFSVNAIPAFIIKTKMRSVVNTFPLRKCHSL